MPCLTQRLCVLLCTLITRYRYCNVITCYSIDSAWLQRLKHFFGKMPSTVAFNFYLRRFNKDYTPRSDPRQINDPEIGRCKMTVSKPVWKAPTNGSSA